MARRNNASYYTRKNKREKELLDLNYQAKLISKKKKLGEKLETCPKCNTNLAKLPCLICDREKIADQIGQELKLEELNLKKECKSRVQDLFKKLNLKRTEITDSKYKIKFIDYDTETSLIYKKDGWIIYWTAVCCHGLVQTGHDSQSLLEFIQDLSKKQRRQIILRAHNGIKFDLKFYWQKIIKEHLKNEWLQQKGLIQGKKNQPPREWGGWAIFQWNNIIHLDSVKILGDSIERLPCSDEQRKIKLEGEELFADERYEKEKYTEEFYKKLAFYCENDVRIQKENVDRINKEIKEVVKKVTGKENVSQKIYKKGTTASLAMYTVRQMIPKEEFNQSFPNFSDPKFDTQREMVQKCYQGASTDSWNEQYLPDTVEVASADVVSTYPNEMRNKPMPVGVGRWVNGIRYDRVNELKDTGFYEIHVEHLVLNKNRSKIPLIELFDEGVKKGWSEVKNKIIWCNGAKWKFINKYYTGKWAIPRGIEFDNKVGLFNNFIDYFFHLKQNPRNNFEKLFAKLMLNSLYGRFGLKPVRSSYQLISKRRNPTKGKPKFLCPERKTYFQWERKEERTRSFSYVPVAAQITAYAWIKLMEMVIKNQDTIIYWDTDCVIVKGTNILCSEGHKKGNELGDWEDGPPRRGWICIAAKLYRTSELVDAYFWKIKLVTKGITKKAHSRVNKILDKNTVMSEYNSNTRKYVLDPQWRATDIGVIIEESRKLFPRPKDNKKRNLVNGNWQPIKDCPEPDLNFLPF